MARHDDPRPVRRSARRLGAVAVAAIGVLAVGVGLSSVALSGLRQPSGGPDSAAAATPSAAPSAVASAAGPSPSASLVVPPTPDPSAPASGPKTRAEIRAAALRTKLQAVLDGDLAKFAIPGASVSIIFRDGSTWTGTSGFADVGAKQPVTADTAFALASVSKTYTAALILDLVRQRAIDLDATAVSYVPEAAIDPRITIRQLLDHTSGLDDFFLHTPIDKALLADRDAFWSVRRTLKYVAKPYFPPGRGWHYSNTNYVYLGLIAERVTGEPLAAALRERFFAPLDLDATWYQAVEKPSVALAHGYRFAGGGRSSPPIDLATAKVVAPFTSVISAAGGAGSIAATSPDAARWARLLYGGRVLGPATTAEMLGAVAGTAGYNPRVPYGLGVQAFPINGRLAVGHSGRLLGFRSAVRHFPGEGVTIAILTNQSRTDPGILVADLLAVVFAPDPPCFRCQNPV